ncbi:muramoyltetrapeptide carboxypeptidase [Natronincola peptidivorans]|uniref:Muramoyltetrapeptide carboxypeptidase n=1 Tax=Natronincola peptidivorans TaxID=426128 RepID=A0A1I0FZ29_9FIRM|nr:LD-carboxypeptidase [Natronincola peptidivorans]SET63795.1 muramoyltetrapeptide carboxypeptidase [Natronincola peptidivorans]
MIKPKALTQGDTIGVIAPSSPATEDKVQLAVEELTKLGFKVKLTESCYATHGYLAGSDELRAEDFNRMFNDKEVQGIICLRGGYGAMKILHKIDQKAIKNNPKVFIGYSDITSLHLLINQNCNLVTFHGPMAAADIAKGLDDFSKESFLKAVTKSEAMGLIGNPEDSKIECIVKGEARGKIVGGNLALVSGTMGTPYEIDTRGKLLFLEEIGEEPYRVDRMLTQLALAGKLEDAEGVILGDWNDCDPQKRQVSLSLMEVFEEIIVPYGKPTIYNLKAGHCTPKVTLPFGVEAALKATEGKLYIEEAATS